jgi:hypothetical protein
MSVNPREEEALRLLKEARRLREYNYEDTNYYMPIWEKAVRILADIYNISLKVASNRYRLHLDSDDVVQ